MADFERLTVETSAAIGAFMQQLAIQAEGGKPVDEETIALRMLASVNADPDYDLSNIHSLNASSDADAAPVTASANGDDRLERLATLLKGDTMSSAEQVAKGQIPKAPPITLLPSYTDRALESNYATLMEATALVQLYANIMQFQQKPEGFDITTEACAAFNSQAKSTYDAMMGPMAGFFMFASCTRETFNDTIPKDQVHSHLLGKIFNGFGFDQATIDALDSQLTSFVAGLAGVNTDNSPTDTMDFCLRLNLVPKKNLTGDEQHPVFIYQPTTFIIYMKIDAQTFRQSVTKNSSIDQVNFKFSLDVFKCELNTDRFQRNRSKFERIFEMVVNQSLQGYSELLNKQIKTNEPNPGANK